MRKGVKVEPEIFVVVGAVALVVLVLWRLVAGPGPKKQRQKKKGGGVAWPKMGYADDDLPPAGKRAPAAGDRLAVEVDGHPCEVVGEGSHQGALKDATGYPTTAIEQACWARLVREPENVHDPYAVRVEIWGRRVGYLKSRYAREAGPVVGDGLWCEALVYGGGLTEEGEPRRLGVWLAFDVEAERGRG